MAGVEWFQQLFGAPEPPDVSKTALDHLFEIRDDETTLFSKSNGRSFHIGRFQTPSVRDLHARFDALVCERRTSAPIKFTLICDESGALIRNPANAGSVFMAASQFNCLEMPSPDVTPDDGITAYIDDKTQGPACALATAPALVYRNYFVPICRGGIAADYRIAPAQQEIVARGQCGGEQINLATDIQEAIDRGGAAAGACVAAAAATDRRSRSASWYHLENGYLFFNSRRLLQEFNSLVVRGEASTTAVQAMRVGLLSDAEVAGIPGFYATTGGHRVTQVYTSALPIGYHNEDEFPDVNEFETFAKICLTAAYEATLLAAAIQALETNQRVKCFLVPIGAGVFGNPMEWVLDALGSTIRKFASTTKIFPVDVFFVVFQPPPPAPPRRVVTKQLQEFRKEMIVLCDDSDSVVVDSTRGGVLRLKMTLIERVGGTERVGQTFIWEFTWLRREYMIILNSTDGFASREIIKCSTKQVVQNSGPTLGISFVDVGKSDVKTPVVIVSVGDLYEE